MSNTVTPLSDGGRVESWLVNGALHLQKYGAGGNPVGAEYAASYNSNQAPQVVALSNGGYAAMVGFVFKGSENPIYVFDGAGAQVASLEAAGNGIGDRLYASPAGGFLVVSMDAHSQPGGSDFAWRPFLTLYDNAGVAVRGPVGLAGDLPSVTVGADGHYAVAWQDGDLRHSLDIDPAHPPAFAKPAAPGVTLIDDQGANTGPISGPFTTDATPVVRVAVSEVGTVLVNREASGNAEHTLDGGVTVTAVDVARGYVDVVPTGPAADGMGVTFYAHFKSAEGVVSDASAKGVTLLLRPDIWSVTDDAGPQTGALADHATTDDATPTLRIGLESSGLKAGDAVSVWDNGSRIALPVLTDADVARGYVEVTTPALAAGDHALSANIQQKFTITVAAASEPAPPAGATYASPGPYSTVAGGAGDDTLVASAGGDTLSGGAGADVFQFRTSPWSPVHVTDFAVGSDRLDFSAVLNATGYVGADPVADKVIWLQPDGAGGTQVLFDRDGTAGGQQWPDYVMDLEHAPTAGLTWAKLTGGADQPPPPPSGNGEAIASHQYADTLAGTAGNDTLTAGQGPDRITGGDGADRFVFPDLPWNAGHITDFTPGADRLDLSALFAGYHGADPLADHWLEFRPDGQGGTQVYVDHDGPDAGDWPFLITSLDGVAPAQVGPGDWIGA